MTETQNTLDDIYIISKEPKSNLLIASSENKRKDIIRPLILPKGIKLIIQLQRKLNIHDEELKNTSNKNDLKDIISFYSGPSTLIQISKLEDFFKSKLISDNKISLELIKELPPDLVCSFIEIEGFGVFGVSSSGKSSESGVEKFILSSKNETLMHSDDFHKLFLGKKRKQPNFQKRKRQKVTKYDGVEISEWVQIDDDDEYSFIDNQLHKPGDGVCIFNWASFRYTAAKRLQEKLQRDKKFGTIRKSRKSRS